ncbi:hypothetical protein [uncultured Croceitalea sp.]|uniref:DUF6973 domain-containing protein n=1 Tax=uncultured Croceitalea sp. TaxID=1798908 RepID=UPI0033061E3F
MNLFKTLRRINFKSFWQLFKLGLSKPFFILPTLNATRECLSISTEYFGRLHYQNTPANAFRHAFWNYLIAKKCTKWSRRTETLVKWAKNITDWHENAFRNRELARKMDLHNNKVGRAVFIEYKVGPVEEVIALLLEMTKNSIRITEQSVFEKHQSTLVHLTE